MGIRPKLCRCYLKKEDIVYTPINGFSKLSKEQKIDFLIEHWLNNDKQKKHCLQSFWYENENQQRQFDEFSENTITNFHLPYGIVPNILINGRWHCIPMVTEESSVVAACAGAGKFWARRGGIKSDVTNTQKVGQVHLIWKGSPQELREHFDQHHKKILADAWPLLANMQKRGGGLEKLQLIDKTDKEPGYYQLWATFQTCNAMGANFINSVLEFLGKQFRQTLVDAGKDIDVIMAILSNYTPNCLVRSHVSCPVNDLYHPAYSMQGEVFAHKFARAIRIAQVDVHRAVTHNKGIMNGIDSVILATGNDFRAVEACAHAHASHTGTYQPLTDCRIEGDIFSFSLELPMALGTVGGLTDLHPLAGMSLDILQRPSASELMQIAASVGLLQNFAALASLITKGIQKGHMKMHLMNILNRMEATEKERQQCKEHFKTKVISVQAVQEYMNQLRNYQ